MRVNLDEINKRIDEKLIKVSEDPFSALKVYNYSDLCSYEGKWDQYTLMCRGLVLLGDKIVSRPFPKFFNLGEEHAPPIPNEPFEVQEKMDGSLISVSKSDNNLVITSRGSFISDQAHWAKEIIVNKYPQFYFTLDEGVTYMFELIHPFNRIVVDYGKEKDLYLLAAIDNDTGRDVEVDPIGTPCVKVYDYNDLENLPEEENAEGYVVRFLESDTRLKIKNPEYIRVHRIRFNATPKRMWEQLREGNNPLGDMEGIPDEFFSDVEGIVKGLIEDFEYHMHNVQILYGKMDRELDNPSRKDQAMWIKQQDKKYQSMLFAMISSKDYSDGIWKLVKPEKEENDRVT